MPRHVRKVRKGSGVRRSGGALLRAGERPRRYYGRGTRAVGGSMTHRMVPFSVREKKIDQLNKIIKGAATGKESRGAVTQKLKSWASSAHNLAQKYGLYSKGAQVARLGYNMWRAKKGQPAIGYTPTPTITYVD